MSPRPKYLNLLQIRMPAPAVVSILHRISGAAMFLLLPYTIWMFDASLTSEVSYEQFASVFSFGAARANRIVPFAHGLQKVGQGAKRRGHALASSAREAKPSANDKKPERPLYLRGITAGAKNKHGSQDTGESGGKL